MGYFFASGATELKTAAPEFSPLSGSPAAEKTFPLRFSNSAVRRAPAHLVQPTLQGVRCIARCKIDQKASPKKRSSVRETCELIDSWICALIDVQISLHFLLQYASETRPRPSFLQACLSCREDRR